MSKFWLDYGLVISVTSTKFLYFTTSVVHMIATSHMFKIGATEEEFSFFTLIVFRL